MATQWQTFPIEFRGGLISNLSPLQHGASAVGSATILQNYEPNKEGGYSKVKGYTKFSSTKVTGSGPILALKVMGPAKAVVARKNATNYTQYYYGTGTTWTSMATSASTNGGKARHVEFNLDGNDKVLFVDGTNYPGVYNASDNTMTFMTSSDSSDVEAAEHVAMFKNTAFFAKGNNLYFTAPFTVDDFSAANGAGTINIGHDVTGLTVFRDQLIIFTTDTVKRLSGNTSADFQVSSITDRIGCINGDTIQEVGGDIMYLAPDGIRLLSATDRIGDFGLDVASDKIYKDANTFLNSTSTFASVLMREKSQYRIFAYISSEQDETAKGLTYLRICQRHVRRFVDCFDVTIIVVAAIKARTLIHLVNVTVTVSEHSCFSVVRVATVRYIRTDAFSSSPVNTCAALCYKLSSNQTFSRFVLL